MVHRGTSETWSALTIGSFLGRRSTIASSGIQVFRALARGVREILLRAIETDNANCVRAGSAVGHPGGEVECSADSLTNMTAEVLSRESVLVLFIVTNNT